MAGLLATIATVVLVAPALAGAGRPGSLDPSFGHRGKVAIHRANGSANSVDIGRKGRIVAAGTHTVARLRPDGHLDRSFGKRGITRLGSGAYAGAGSFVALGPTSVAVDAKGAVFVAGAACSGSLNCDFAVSRLTPDGKLDQSFGQGGTARVGFAKPDNEALSIAIAAGGRLVVGGSSCTTRECEFALARLNRNGDLDPSFGNGGKVLGSAGGRCSFPLRGMALDSRGRIVVGGSCLKRIASLARFKPNGEPDPSFGNGGKVNRRVPIHDVDALAVDSRDRIDLAGRYLGAAGILRFRRGGNLDSSFGSQGVARAHPPKHSSMDSSSIALDSRGRIVVAERSVRPRGFAFARFKPDGHVNRQFGHHGTRIVRFGQHGFDFAASAAIDGHDRIVGAGSHPHDGHKHFALLRLHG